jgi:hypothetical protein
MNAALFNDLLRVLAAAPSRRALLARLTGGLLVAQLVARDVDDVAAKHKHKHKHKKQPCATVGQAPSKKRKRCCQGLVPDGAGRCCRPASCAPPACGSVPDGCGGSLSCGCTGNTICLTGTCQPCDVCSSGCGFRSVQQAIDAAAAGASIRLCAGLYTEDLTLTKSLSLIGAGPGTGAGDTILHGSGTTSVVRNEAAVTVSLQHLRITGGVASFGGGILHADGTLALTSCTVSGNTAAVNGGGMYTSLGTVTLDAASEVTGNAADPTDPDSGGGIYNSGSAVTLSRADTVSGNTPDNCSGTAVPLCSG